MTYKYTHMRKTFSWVNPEGGIRTGERDDLIGGSFVPNETAVGSFITFPDGSKFRRATDHSKSTAWVEPKTPQHTEYNWGPPGNVKGVYITSPGGYNGDIVWHFGWDMFTPVVPDHVMNPPRLTTGLRNEISTKALLDLADAKANIGENLATLRQTLQLVRHPLETIVKDVRKMKADRGIFKFFRMSYRDITHGRAFNGDAGEYLKYFFGWKLLLQDIFGLLELAKESGKKPLLIHAEGKARDERFHADRQFGLGSESQRTRAFNLTSMSKAKCHIWAQPDPNWAGSRTLNQLGLLNPASLAWELVPASFVVDWVLPIGPVLQALTAPAGLSFVNGSSSIRVSARGEYSQVYETDYGPPITNPVPATGLIAYEGYRREVLHDWPRPGFYFDSDPLRLKSDGSDRIFKFLALSLLSMKSL